MTDYTAMRNLVKDFNSNSHQQTRTNIYNADFKTSKQLSTNNKSLSPATQGVLKQTARNRNPKFVKRKRETLGKAVTAGLYSKKLKNIPTINSIKLDFKRKKALSKFGIDPKSSESIKYSDRDIYADAMEHLGSQYALRGEK